MKQTKLVFTAIFIIFLFLATVVPLYAEEAQEYVGAVLGVNKNERGESRSQGQGSGRKVTVGNVEKVTENKITIEEKKENKKTEAVIDKDTKVIGQERKTLRLEEIKVKDRIAIISSESAKPATRGGEIKRALKVFVKPATSSAEMKRRAVQGVITNISGSVITLAHQIQRERVYMLMVSEQTVIKIKGMEDATIANLAVGQRIAAMGDLTETGILARRIHVIPGKATGIFKRYPLVATPSATPLPTGEATPTATPIITITPTATPSPTLELTPTPTP